MTGLFRSLIRALLLCVITAAVLILIFGAVADSSSDSTKNLALFGRATLFTSAFIGALSMSLSRDTGKLTSSILFGGVYIFICFALSLLFGDTELLSNWVSYLTVIAVCIVCAFIGSKKKGKKPKNLKKFKSSTKK